MSYLVIKKEIYMGNQLVQDEISDALEGKTLFFSSEAVTKIAAGNGETLAPADLGAVVLEPKARTTIEPLFDKSILEKSGAPDVKQDLAGLRIHNPDGSQITIRMDEYKGRTLYESIKNEIEDIRENGVAKHLDGLEMRSKDGDFASTEDLRFELYTAYKRIAETRLGTDAFTQNAKFFTEASWTNVKESEEAKNNPDKANTTHEAQLSGNMRDKTSSEQDDIIYRQHDYKENAILKKEIEGQKLPNLSISGESNDAQYNKTASPSQLSAAQFTKLFSQDMTPENQEKFLAEMDRRINKVEPMIEIYQQTTDAKNERS